MLQMHFCNAYIFLWKMFSCAKMLCFLLCKKQSCVHFVLLNIFLWKMYAKMHFCIKCIFAPTKCYKCILATRTFSFGKCSAYIFQRKMFSITFDFVKCSASHFPKENVQHRHHASDERWPVMPWFY